MLVKDILKKHNVVLQLTEGLSDLDVEGEFTSYHIRQLDNNLTMYIFYDDDSSIRIIPNNTDATELVHYFFKPNEGLGQSKFYNYDGILIAEEVAVRDLEVQ